MNTVKAVPLNGNASLNRWRYVIKNGDGSTAWSSRYAYASHAEAIKAGERQQVRLLRKDRNESGVRQFKALGLKAGRT